jgi:flagellar biosynthesis protein FlhG
MDPRTHYEVLGVEPAASPEQLDRAYRFCLDLYGEGSLATYSLLDPEEMREARQRVEEAYGVLRDPARRRVYDETLGFERPQVPTCPADASGCASGLVVLTEPVTGPALRRFREQKGIGLREISLRSKVGVRYLEYIEQERHAMLPPPVYLRGFLQEYASALGLEPRRTAEAYMALLPPPPG